MMRMSRREFMAVGLAGTAGLCVGRNTDYCSAAESPLTLPDEDGYKLWLRYTLPGDAVPSYRKVVQHIRVDGDSATCGIIRSELNSATQAMLGSTVPSGEANVADGTVIVGTPGNSALIRGLNWAADLSAVGDEGFIIRSARVGNKPVTVIAANGDIGALCKPPSRSIRSTSPNGPRCSFG